jgi:tryptophan-rich sensory protein
MKNWLKFLLCLLFPLLTGVISGVATVGEVMGWYSMLDKPSFNPPPSVFGPVWTVLYLLMGVSLYLIVTSPQSGKGSAITLFCIQLALNFGWSFIFFKLHMIGLALMDIILLWLCILLMVTWFYRIRKSAGLLQIFYLLWVSFATVLNASILYLNR